MEKTKQIALYRKRLEKTLASPDLTDKQSLKTLVKNQLIRSSLDETEGKCSENAIEKRTTELYNFLEMLRSASVNDKEVPKTRETSSAEWKLARDNEELRIMYREGPPGTPFHSLLVEGYIDGPADVCLCVSWEATLYRKWWPHFVIPTFKLVSSKCLQKVRVGEHISLVRMKVPWPLSPREAVVHYFEFEYFQDDLIVILISTVSELESIGRSGQACFNDGIPEPQDAVRIDLLGGFSYQKVTSERTYFREIGNIDLKMDFVPPSLINFIARQIVGDGFRLYLKAVASAYNHDEDFGKALCDPKYTRIHEALYSTKKPNLDLDQKELKSDARASAEVDSINSMQDNTRDMDQKPHKDHERDPLRKNMLVTDKTDTKTFGEIIEMEEEENEDTRPSEDDFKTIDQLPHGKSTEKGYVNRGRNTSISHEVEQALGMLERVIYMVREHGYNPRNIHSLGLTHERLPKVEDSGAKDSTSSEDGKCSNSEVCVEVSKVEVMEKKSHDLSFRNSAHKFWPGTSSRSMQVNHNKIAPASPEETPSYPNESHQVVFSSSTATEAPVPTKIEHANKQVEAEATSAEEHHLNEEKELEKPRKHSLCCISFSNWKLGAL